MTPTAKEARRELADRLSDAVGQVVKAVYPAEQFNETNPGCWVSVSTAGISAEDLLLAVRVYVQVSNIPGEQAADALDDAVEAVEDELDDYSAVGPVAWEHGYDERLNAITATLVVQRGREDLFD